MVYSSTSSPRSRKTILEGLTAKQRALVEMQVEVLRLFSELAAVEREHSPLAVLRLDAEPLMIPLKEAARMAGRSPETLKAWASAHGFGWRAKTEAGRPGHWLIDRDAFVEYLRVRSTPKRSH